VAYRGIEAVQGLAPMGHEYVGIVEEVGSAVSAIKPGQFVIGFVLRLGQHLRDLPGRLPELVHPP
jgi:threonine dehydrogenase-like Zn-dependent dehydrogenase